MRVTGLVVLAAGATLALACASVGRTTTVRGPSNDVAALAGEWRGEYRSEESGRQGAIYFRLQPDENKAVGDAVMLSRRGARIVNWEERVTMSSARYLAEVLTVSFVGLEGGMVSGRLDPYVDPDCGNVHVTTFFGEVRGGRIAGRYISRSNAHEPHTGEWTATRLN